MQQTILAKIIPQFLAKTTEANHHPAAHHLPSATVYWSSVVHNLAANDENTIVPLCSSSSRNFRQTVSTSLSCHLATRSTLRQQSHIHMSILSISNWAARKICHFNMKCIPYCSCAELHSLRSHSNNYYSHRVPLAVWWTYVSMYLNVWKFHTVCLTVSACTM